VPRSTAAQPKRDAGCFAVLERTIGLTPRNLTPGALDGEDEDGQAPAPELFGALGRSPHNTAPLTPEERAEDAKWRPFGL